MTVTSCWTSLCAGERVAVRSLSGNRYEGILLCAGPSGVFMRMPGRGIVRLILARIDTETLEVLGAAAPLERDDEVMLRPRRGRDLRGRVEEADQERLVVSASNSPPVAVSFVDVEPGSIYLLFRATSLHPGDQFLLRSRSGRAYRGRAVDLTPRYLVADLEGRARVARLRTDEIDLRTVEVLIPLRLEGGEEPS